MSWESIGPGGIFGVSVLYRQDNTYQLSEREEEPDGTGDLGSVRELLSDLVRAGVTPGGGDILVWCWTDCFVQVALRLLCFVQVFAASQFGAVLRRDECIGNVLVESTTVKRFLDLVSAVVGSRDPGFVEDLSLLLLVDSYQSNGGGKLYNTQQTQHYHVEEEHDLVMMQSSTES